MPTYTVAQLLADLARHEMHKPVRVRYIATEVEWPTSEEGQPAEVERNIVAQIEGTRHELGACVIEAGEEVRS